MITEVLTQEEAFVRWYGQFIHGLCTTILIDASWFSLGINGDMFCKGFLCRRIHMPYLLHISLWFFFCLCACAQLVLVDWISIVYLQVLESKRPQPSSRFTTFWTTSVPQCLYTYPISDELKLFYLAMVQSYPHCYIGAYACVVRPWVVVYMFFKNKSNTLNLLVFHRLRNLLFC